MILGLSSLHFWLILLLAFCAGALGACLVLIIKRFATKKKDQTHRLQMEDRNNWQRLSRDEQLYNGR